MKPNKLLSDRGRASRRASASLLSVLFLTLHSGSVLSQDVSLAPTYGSVTLASGFSPDPHVVEMTAGGSIDASTTNSDCVGYISDSPDFSLNYEEQNFALSIFASADADITLMVNAPDGTWHCNDDSVDLNGTNPGVHFSSPQSGRYDIWVGAYSTDNNYLSTRLFISELGTEEWQNLVESASSSAPQDTPAAPVTEPDPVDVTPAPEPEPAAGAIQYGRKII